MPTVRGFSHVEVTVRNLERSLYFYRDLVGLKVFQEGSELDEIGQDYSGVYERPEPTYRYAMLMGGSAAIVLIEFSPSTGASIKIDHVGISHFGLYVDGLDAVYDELKRRGVEFRVPPHEFMKTPLGVMRSAFAVDPDGVIVQFDELTPTD